jgi:hypothetical protein
MSTYNSFINSPFFSTKHSTYFQAYDEILEVYKGKNIVLVEVGVLSGGSLFMWRDFLGHQARIIGVDANPLARKWEGHGFEIEIGDQGDPMFWTAFFKKVGQVDVLIDDGGHTFKQQIVTTLSGLPFIKDGGTLIVEDTHTSYMDGFGAKSKSFMKWSYAFMDGINMRFSGFLGKAQNFSSRSPVWKLSVFESIVAFHIDRNKASLTSSPLANSGARDSADDYRYSNEHKFISRVQQLLQSMAHSNLLQPISLIGFWILNRFRSDSSALRELFKI